jgi:hypothetical protein
MATLTPEPHAPLRHEPVAEKEINIHEQPKALQPVARLAARLGTRVLATAFVLLVLFLVIWYTTPYILRDYLNKKGSSLPDYNLNIHWVEINPLACDVKLENVVLQKKSNAIPVPFFVARKVLVAMQWTQIIHFDFRSNVTLFEPVVNFVNGPTAATTQTILEPAWVTAVKQTIPLKINQFKIHNGDIHYYDFHANPEINLELTSLELVADNLTNTTRSKDLMPQTITITGHPLKTGSLEAHLTVNVDLKQPTFAEKVALDNVPMPALNAFIAKYMSVYAKSGYFSFRSEMVSKEGSYDGYMKPFFKDLQFEPMPKDRDGLAAMWASIVNGLKGILENDDTKTVATQVPVHGQYKDPNIDFWSAAFGVLQNAWFDALAQKFNSPGLAPGGKAPDKPKVEKPVAPRP